MLVEIGAAAECRWRLPSPACFSSPLFVGGRTDLFFTHVATALVMLAVVPAAAFLPALGRGGADPIAALRCRVTLRW